MLLKEADKVEVTVLVDNYTDLLMLIGTEVVTRPMVFPPQKLLAEHGFSLLIKVYLGSEVHTILMDTGASNDCIFHNADVLNINLAEVETVVLSHGHYDHFGGLIELLKRADRSIPVVVHPGAFLERRLNFPIFPEPVDLTRLDETPLKEAGAEIKKESLSSMLCSDLVLISGEIKRITEFEQGFPFAEARLENEWVVDPFHDDQGLAIHIKGKGLVVIGGCCHSGIINTVKHIQEVTGISKIHSILGGFHLTGPIFETVIDSTIKEIKKIDPDIVIPMHCTGWKAINRFAELLGEKFILNSVGTSYTFQ